MKTTRRLLRMPSHTARGFTLIIGMLMLLVLTLLALAMFRSSGLQERIAAGTRDKQRAMEAAQSALQYGEWWLGQGNALTSVNCANVNSGNTLSNMRVCSNALTTPATLPWSAGSTYLPPMMTVKAGGGLAGASSPSGDINYVASPGLYITYLGLNGAGLAQLYQITAYGYGGDATTAAVVQSTYQLVSGAKDLGQQ